MRQVISLVIATTLCVSAAFAETVNTTAELDQAYQQYLAGADGEKGSVDAAVETFTTLHDERPDDPLVMVLLGGSQTLQGRDAWMPWNKMSFTEEGLAAMGKAQQLLEPKHDEQLFDGLPGSLQVKALAGITFTQVPDFFGRFEQGYQLLLEVSQSELLDDIPAASHSHIHFFAASAAQKADEKERQTMLLERLAALPVDNEYTAAARDALAQAGE